MAYSEIYFSLFWFVSTILIAVQLGRYSSSAHELASSAQLRMFILGKLAYLPGVQFILFCLVVLHQVIKHLLQAILIRLQRRDDVLDRPLDENAIDESEALALFWKRLEGLKNQP